MREVTGDLFAYPADAIVIPTNAVMTKRWRDDGWAPRAVMGAGVAKQAAQRYPDLPWMLGQRLQEHDARVEVFVWPDWDRVIVAVPTKHDWREPSTVNLISLGVLHLKAVADANGWQTVALPRLGCGHGGLPWETVRPILQHRLDDRFVLVIPAARPGPTEDAADG